MEGLWDGSWALALTLLNVALIATLIPRIVFERRDSPATLAWVLGILLVPIVGAAFYWLFGTRRVRRRRLRMVTSKRRLEETMRGMRRLRAPFEPERDPPPDPADACAMHDVFSVAPAAPNTGNRVRVLIDARETYAALEAAIEAARRHIHLAYYIFRDDETGRRFLKLLERKAAEGVEVRLLVDGWGSSDLSPAATEPLVRAGGRFAVFAPVRLLARAPTLNLRNHRKIVVVDGRVGFTGGLNIGDEYRGKLERFSPWRDTHLVIEGPAAERLQEIFAEDWYYATDEALTRHAYFPMPERAGDSVVQIVESGPDESAERIHRAIFVAVTRSERRVWMTSPYFVPDRSLLVAFETAARRGVDVRLLLPARSNSPLTFHAGRSFYPFLLEAGCKVYEYTEGMLHAKTMIVDECWSTVGSANMDRRSFVLNFEANAIVYDAAVNAQLAEVFERDLTRARPATLPASTDWGRRVREALCFVLAPLL